MDFPITRYFFLNPQKRYPIYTKFEKTFFFSSFILDLWICYVKIRMKKTKAVKSLEETNIGWFPSKAIQRPAGRDWNDLEDPWRNGSLLSELVAKLLVDEKSMVKEVSFLCRFCYRVFVVYIRI